MSARARLFVLAGVLGLSACTGNVIGGTGGGTGTGGGGGGVVGADGGACVPQGRNDAIRLGLMPACGGCHVGGSQPFMASLAAFEAAVVYEPRLVTAGDPDGSLLFQMLLGTAPGTYPQMPPGEKYESFVTDGRSTLTLEQLADWIRNLPPRGAVLAEPVPERFTMRRLTAEEMVVSLMDQLGLTLEDFIDTSSPSWRDEAYTVNGGKLFVWPKDWAPGISTQYVSDSRSVERFESLGGMAAVDNRKKDTTLGPAAVQTIVQVSQAWCRRAIEKPGNTAVLRHVTLADQSATKSVEIKQNIRALYLRMLGEVPADATVDELFQQVYLPYEPTSTRAAWTAVCSSFVRHPLWLSF